MSNTQEIERQHAGPAPSQNGILPHHIEHLAASGITPEVAARNGIRSETNSQKIANLLGWKGASRLGACLLFPVRDAFGQTLYQRVRPDRPRASAKGNAVKYESPKGASPQPYFPSGVAEKLGDPTAELVIVEGEKKAIAATEAGFPTIGLFGVYAWKVKGHQELTPALQKVDWKNRRVIICFDSDIDNKPQVAEAEAQLAAVLEAKGAIVRCARLPDGPEGEKWGADDFLVHRSKKDFRKLLDEAMEPEPPDGTGQKPGLRSEMPEAVAAEFLLETQQDGVQTLRAWAGSYWKWLGGRYRELTTADIRGELVRFLSSRYSAIQGRDVSDILLNIHSQCLVLSTVQPPRWLDGGDEIARTWNPVDTFATKSHLINLSMLTRHEPGAIVHASPAYFSMTAADYEFRPDAGPPRRWLQFLNELWPNDPQSIKLLQQWMGYLLTPDTRQQKVLLMVGPKRSGKGTIARVIRQLIGDGNCCAPTLSGLATNFGLSPLLGKPAAIIGDARLSGRTDVAAITERLLSISGEDAITVDRKHRDPMTVQLKARFTIISNELPRLDDASGALAGRLLILRMARSFYGNEDKWLGEALSEERQSILLWAIAGWKSLRDAGRFVEPESSRDLVEQMEDIASPVSQFARECCEIVPGASETLDNLYAEYKSWCESNGRHHAPTKTWFSKDMTAAFPELVRSRCRSDAGIESRSTVLRGVRLRV